MVVTPIIREQLAWTDGQDYLVGANASEFATVALGCLAKFLFGTVSAIAAVSRISAELSSDAFEAAIVNILSGFGNPTCEPQPAPRATDVLR